MLRDHISCLEVECATSALGRASVLPASCVFLPADPQILFLWVWSADNVRAVVMYPMYVWRRGGALGPCNSGMSICF